MLIQIEKTPYHSPYHHQAIALRQVVLRTPVGLVFTEEELEKERHDTHVVALNENTVVGCLVLVALTPKTIKMRQVAVVNSQQGQGLGKQIVFWAEQFAVERGHTTMVMHARESALSFYTQLGYKAVGEPFTEVTLKHWFLEKQLSST
jgi:N-acetylglutamate synthase-like GNAT family acetyltransferase